MRHREAITLIALGIAGPLVAHGQAVRDSAGVRLRNYSADAQPASRWSVDTVPLLTIGGSAGRGISELTGVIGVARLSDGRVAIAHAGAAEIRIVLSDGSLQHVMGRRGQGPEEFDGLTHFFRVADTVVGGDAARRLRYFAPDGKLLRTISRIRFPPRSIVNWHGSRADGTLVLSGLDPPDPGSSASEATLTLGRLSPGGKEVIDFAKIPAFEVIKKAGATGVPGAPGYSPVYLGAASRVVLAGVRVCRAYTAAWEVQCLAPASARPWRTTRQMTRPRVTDEDKRRFVDSFVSTGRTEERAQRAAFAATFDFAQLRPAMGQLLAGVTGEIWVSDFNLAELIPVRGLGRAVPDGPSTWSVLGVDGAWLADVELPARFALMDAGRDYVAGLMRDGDDAERVVVLRLSRGPRP